VTVHSLPTTLLTRPEMAETMRISLRTFDEMRYEGKQQGFPCPQVTWGRRRVLFRPCDVERWGAEMQRRRAAMTSDEQTPEWEVRSNFDHPGNPSVYSVERGTGQSREIAAGLIYDYGLACVIEAAAHLRDGTVP
jgi:hypothetical protein